MKIILKDERPMSWNQLYAGSHWGVRKAEAERVHELVGWTLKEQFPMNRDYPKFEKRVDIHITAYFKNRPQDPDNICSKVYIDGLIGTVIENDARQFVRKVTVQSEIDRDNPRVEIEITEVLEDGIIE